VGTGEQLYDKLVVCNNEYRLTPGPGTTRVRILRTFASVSV